MNLGLGYSDSEDRLWIRIEGTGRAWWMSRRLVLRLILELARMLEATSKPALEQPGGDDRAERSGDATADEAALRDEHASAVRRASDHAGKADSIDGPASDADKVREKRMELVRSARLRSVGRRYEISLLAGEQGERLRMNRDDAHRVLGALVARARRVGWLDAPLPAWLAPGPPD